MPDKLKPYFAIFLLLCSAIFLIIFVPPKNPYLIITFIFLVSYLTYLILLLLFTRKDSMFFCLFIFLFLFLSYVSGFNSITTVLLLSFVTGLRLLVK